MRDLLITVWKNEVPPDPWTKSLIRPIFKKGGRLKSSKYRGISLLPAGYRVLSNILFERLLPHAERGLGRYQCGFRKGRSTTDQIFCLKTILERGKELKIKIHHLFLDFRAA
ncbi:uncharacterized protein [Halyomorpha halys]|uniref:uncharacterized protein n=1 Tax=Halyomorpha halys TaxID=286706 RepID=UPI0034D1A15D